MQSPLSRGQSQWQDSSGDTRCPSVGTQHQLTCPSSAPGPPAGGPKRCSSSLSPLTDITGSAGQPEEHQTAEFQHQIPPSMPILGWASRSVGPNGSWDTWLASGHLLWHLWCPLGWVPWGQHIQKSWHSPEKQNSMSKTHNFSAQTESQMNCLKIRIMWFFVFFSLKFKMYFSQSHSLKRLKQMTIPPLAIALKNEIILRDTALPFSEQVLIKGWQSDPQKKTGFLAHSRRQLQLFEAPFTAEWRVQFLWAVSISTSDH